LHFFGFSYFGSESRDLVRSALDGVALLRYNTFLPPQGLVRFFLCLRLRLRELLTLFI
jgi:hypothetical protein